MLATIATIYYIYNNGFCFGGTAPARNPVDILSAWLRLALFLWSEHLGRNLFPQNLNVLYNIPSVFANLFGNQEKFKCRSNFISLSFVYILYQKIK